MKSYSEPTEKDDLDVFTRIIHLGVIVFGPPAWLVSAWASEYEHAKHLGFTIHSWLGMGLAAFIALRLIYGLVGPTTARFTQWTPYTKKRLLLVWEDILTLLRFRLPDRPSHIGIEWPRSNIWAINIHMDGIDGKPNVFHLEAWSAGRRSIAIHYGKP